MPLTAFFLTAHVAGRGRPVNPASASRPGRIRSGAARDESDRRARRLPKGERGVSRGRKVDTLYADHDEQPPAPIWDRSRLIYRCPPCSRRCVAGIRWARYVVASYSRPCALLAGTSCACASLDRRRLSHALLRSMRTLRRLLLISGSALTPQLPAASGRMGRRAGVSAPPHRRRSTWSGGTTCRVGDLGALAPSIQPLLSGRLRQREGRTDRRCQLADATSRANRTTCWPTLWLVVLR